MADQLTPSLAAKIGEGLYHRIWTSRGWTILGLIGAGAVEAFNEIVLPAMTASPQPWLHGLAVLIATYGAARLSPAAVQAYAAKKQAEQDAKALPALPPPQGFVSPRALAFLFAAALVVGALIALSAPRFARADDPQFGTCWSNGTCIGPRVAAPALAIDLKTGVTQAGFLPGLGYGVEFTSYRIPWGLSCFANVRPTAEGEKFAPSAMVDFFRYVHAGIGWQVGGHAYGLLTLGTDLGSASPPAVATPAK
jgi:hypothetical protein